MLGEEFGATDAPAGPGSRVWVIDPIDGTKNYIRGVPIWGTLIALMEGDQAMVGMVSAPALGRRWWAARGHGAFAGRHRAGATPIKVSGVSRLSDASFCYSDVRYWEQAGRLDGMLDIMRRTWRNRAYGDFYGYMLVAEGAVEVMVEPELSLWDMAALAVIVTEAGGMFTSVDGVPGVKLWQVVQYVSVSWWPRSTGSVLVTAGFGGFGTSGRPSSRRTVTMSAQSASEPCSMNAMS